MITVFAFFIFSRRESMKPNFRKDHQVFQGELQGEWLTGRCPPHNERHSKKS